MLDSLPNSVLAKEGAPADVGEDVPILRIDADDSTTRGALAHGAELQEDSSQKSSDGILDRVGLALQVVAFLLNVLLLLKTRGSIASWLGNKAGNIVTGQLLQFAAGLACRYRGQFDPLQSDDRWFEDLWQATDDLPTTDTSENAINDARIASYSLNAVLPLKSRGSIAGWPGNKAGSTATKQLLRFAVGLACLNRAQSEPLQSDDRWFDDLWQTTDDLPATDASENAINDARIAWYRRQFSQEFLRQIRESEFEFGCRSAAEDFIRARLKENAFATRDWINELFVDHYEDVGVVVGIIRVIAHLDFHEMAPHGPTIALAATRHRSLEVRECGIRALENWGTAECLKILKNVHCPEAWMASYVAQVISDLEKSLAHAAVG